MSTVGILLIVFFIYAFAGILSFIPWLFGFIWSMLILPVNIINQSIYLVGNIVYITFAGVIAFVVVGFIINLFKNHH